jgi:outer membrane lipoprotein SlyB
MKLYIVDKITKEKTYLQLVAPDKTEFSKKIGGQVFFVNGNTYSVNDVTAEPTTDSAAVGGLLGGFVGSVGGAGGVILGGLLGAIIGQSQGDKDQKEAERFNGSNA